MSFQSRHSPRFSYAYSDPPCPTERIGQSTFWGGESRGGVRRPLPQQALYMYDRPSVGMLSHDERNLITVLGVGIIVALLIDAVSRSRS